MFQGSGWLIALALVVLIGVVAAMARIAVLRMARRKHRVHFEKARSRSYAESSAAYKEALEKLSSQWDVIEIIHDWSEFNLGPAGLPEYITFEQAFNIVRQIRAAKDHPIAMVIHTMGGYSVPSDMIAKALSQHKGKKVAFVPYMAMSGGTVIALAADEISMGSAAALGAIDTQYAGWPASAFAFLKASKNIDYISDAYLMMVHISEQFERDAVSRAQKLVNPAHDAKVASELIMGGRPHGETISVAEARELGVNVAKKECPGEFYALVDARLSMVAKEREKVFEHGLDIQRDGTGVPRTNRSRFGARHIG
jgi:ClpP class serine protease